MKLNGRYLSPKHPQTPSKRLGKGVQTSSKKNFIEQKALIFVHLVEHSGAASSMQLS